MLNTCILFRHTLGTDFSFVVVVSLCITSNGPLTDNNHSVDFFIFFYFNSTSGSERGCS